MIRWSHDFKRKSTQLIENLCFSMALIWRWRSKLALYVAQQGLSLSGLDGLSPAYLAQHAIKCLIFDFDGVLAPHGAKEPEAAALACLRRLVASPQLQVYFLSNKPEPARIAYLKSVLPQAHFVQGVRKKPYPDGLLFVQKHSDTPMAQMGMLDDRLSTGILAAATCGARPLWLTKPVRDFKTRPLAESFYSGLRLLERCWFGMPCVKKSAIISEEKL